MYAFTKLAAFVVSTLGLASSIAAAAPTDSATPSDLEARAPYDVHNGLASYYSPSIGYGECRWQNKDEEWVAAISTALFQEMSPGPDVYHNVVCGMVANVSYGGKTVKVGVVDRCPSCGYNDISLSPAAFQQFAPLATNRLSGVSWKFN